jgi:hypothetical protein
VEGDKLWKAKDEDALGKLMAECQRDYDKLADEVRKAECPTTLKEFRFNFQKLIEGQSLQLEDLWDLVYALDWKRARLAVSQARLDEMWDDVEKYTAAYRGSVAG